MKKLFTLTLAAALAIGSQSAFAEAKKKEAPASPEAAATKPKAADTGKPKEGGDAAKPKKDSMPMYVRADEIDAKAKTITQVTKDGKKGVNTVTSTTEIKNGDKAAKFEDIKVGDYVAGLRKKTGENAYEVLKITKFGAKAAKPEGDAKKPAAEPKKK
jgi:hypothetical protein